MSVISAQTHDQELEIITAPFITSGNHKNDIIEIILDKTWPYTDEYDYHITLFRTDSPEECYIPTAFKSSYERKVTCRIPDEIEYAPGAFCFGVWCENSETGNMKKTSNPVEHSIFQGIYTTGLPVNDWDEIKEDIIDAMNTSLNTSLSLSSSKEDIIEAIQSNPMIDTVEKWDSFIEESSRRAHDNSGYWKAFASAYWYGAVPHLNTPNMTSAFGILQGSTRITEFSFDASNVTSFANAFYNNTALKKVTVKNCSSSATNFNQMFYSAENIKEVVGELDFTSANNVGAMFTMSQTSHRYALEEIRFKENTLSVSLDVSYCDKLSADSLNSIMNSLKQLDEGVSRTITFNTSRSSMISQEEINAATAKGWSVAFNR